MLEKISCMASLGRQSASDFVLEPALGRGALASPSKCNFPPSCASNPMTFQTKKQVEEYVACWS